MPRTPSLARLAVLLVASGVAAWSLVPWQTVPGSATVAADTRASRIASPPFEGPVAGRTDRIGVAIPPSRAAAPDPSSNASLTETSPDPARRDVDLPGAAVATVASTPGAFLLAADGPRAFSPNGDGVADTLRLRLRLPAEGRVTVEVRSFDGTEVAHLIDATEPGGGIELSWTGAGVPDGPYTIVASAAGRRALVHVARWSTLPRLSAPGSITVVLDPGHGGSDDGGGTGTLPDGRRITEKATNLDIALRAGAMLEAAGITVRYTRTTDRTVPLRERIRFANAVRADAFVAIHNNFVPGGGGRTEGFYCGTGCASPGSSRRLAEAILDAHLARLAPFESDGWRPTPNPESGWAPRDDWDRWGDDGVAGGATRHFYVLGPYDRTFRPNAIVMAGALSESLAANDGTELAMLADSTVRTALGAAYADGIARFLASRRVGVRLATAGSIAPAHVGRTTSIRVRVTNTGAAPIPAGSTVIVGDRRRVGGFDASLTSGTPIGRRRLPAALAPGHATIVAVRARPAIAGPRSWIVDFVVGGARLRAYRIPTLQLRPNVR